MRLLAVDPGYSRVGVSVLDGETLLYCAELLITSKQEKFAEKLTDLTWKYYLEFLRLAHKFEIDHVGSELIPAKGGFASHDGVVSVGAALKSLSVQNRLRYQHIAAVEAKKSQTGNAQATKIQMKKRVLELYPSFPYDFPEIKHNHYDAYDSVLIGRALIQKNNWTNPPTSAFTGKAW